MINPSLGNLLLSGGFVTFYNKIVIYDEYGADV